MQLENREETSDVSCVGIQVIPRPTPPAHPPHTNKTNAHRTPDNDQNTGTKEKQALILFCWNANWSMPRGHMSSSCEVWKKKRCTGTMKLGDALFACETGENEVRAVHLKHGSLTQKNQQDQGAAHLEPTHPPARCPKRQDSKKPNNKRQASNDPIEVNLHGCRAPENMSEKNAKRNARKMQNKCQKICQKTSKDVSEDMLVNMSANMPAFQKKCPKNNVKKYGRKECQKICQKI